MADKTYSASELEFASEDLDFEDKAPSVSATAPKPSLSERGLDFLLNSAGIDSASLGRQLEAASASLPVRAAMAGTGAIAAGGRAINAPIQRFAGAIPEFEARTRAGFEARGIRHPILGPFSKGAAIGAGTALGTAADVVLPQDRLSAALLPAQALGMLARAPAGQKAIQTGISAARTRLAKPGPIAKLAGQVATVRTGVPARFAEAVMADPAIMSAKTPSMAEVSKEYAEVLGRIGKRVDSALFKKLTGSRFPPTDQQVGKLQRLVDETQDILDAMAGNPKAQKLDEAQALLARQAAAAIQRSNAAAMNPRVMSVATGAKYRLDDYLAQSGLPELRDLSAKYFRAAAKEAFEPWLPQSKNLSPNALRAHMMLLTAAGAIGGATTSPLLAAGGLAFAASGSPKVVGQLVRLAGATGKFVRGGARPAALRSTPFLPGPGRRAFSDVDENAQ